ncbi:MAG: metalloregulator ArsR/SmtB family transcription factor [Candidatus Lokiarchaeota archaeon]
MEEIMEMTADLMKVLADYSRLNIILLIKDGQKNPKEIEEELGRSQSTISQHLKILSDADIIDFEKNGKSKIYFLKNKEILNIIESIKWFVIEQQKAKAKSIHDLDRLDTLL